MPNPLRSLLASTGLCLLAPAALADLTADAVWADWKAYVTGFGYTISGQETDTAEGLVVTGILVESGAENPAGDASLAVSRIVLTEAADGTVTIALPTIMPFETTAPNDTGGTTRISMDYRQQGLTIVASGTPDALRYAYDAQEISLQSTGFEVNGQVLPPETNSVDVTLERISGTTDMTLGSHRRYDQQVQAGALRYNLVTGDATLNTRAEISGQTQGVSFTGQSTLPLRTVDTTDMDAMLAAGFSVTGRFAVDATAMTFSVNEPSRSVEVSVTAGEGTIGVGMDQTGLNYALSQGDLRADVVQSQFPLPLGFGVAQAGVNLTMPLRQSETPEDFGLGITLDGFSMDETLWSLFDPGGQLPRDPASLVVDLAGKARLLFNLFDPANINALSPDAPPVEVAALDINSVRLSAAGAELTGAGAFTFDNSQAEAPQAQGALNLTLTGGNALLDRLVTSGILPEDQAMGARMMLGLLAVPTDTPDTLRSRIEINQEGHVLANGQRIR